jgi:hypothetical protein
LVHSSAWNNHGNPDHIVDFTEHPDNDISLAGKDNDSKMDGYLVSTSEKCRLAGGIQCKAWQILQPVGTHNCLNLSSRQPTHVIAKI